FASLFPIVLCSLYWRRTTAAGVIASVISMVAVWMVFFYQDIINPTEERLAEGGDFLVLGLMPVTFTFAASASALVLVSMLTKPPSEATVNKFFALKKALQA
ncbi:MAG: sodium:solute symporter family protein, partial [Myxococcota bacterium]